MKYTKFLLVGAFPLIFLFPLRTEAADLYSVIYSDAGYYNGNPVECDWIANAILYASASYNVDPLLITAVMETESHFYMGAGSSAGAIGLMQLMPQTAAWIARQLGESFTKDDLYDPAFNIRYGVWYLAELEREFGGNDILALAAYNAGRGNVRDWMERWHWNNTFNEIEAIPYPETRLYVRRVLEDREQYKRLYEE